MPLTVIYILFPLFRAGLQSPGDGALIFTHTQTAGTSTNRGRKKRTKLRVTLAKRVGHPVRNPVSHQVFIAGQTSRCSRHEYLDDQYRDARPSGLRASAIGTVVILFRVCVVYSSVEALFKIPSPGRTTHSAVLCIIYLSPRTVNKEGDFTTRHVHLLDVVPADATETHLELHRRDTEAVERGDGNGAYLNLKPGIYS